MDAFIASIEAERRNLAGEPLVVCVYSGRTENSGAVSTASYEARSIGINAGMPIQQAQEQAEATDRDVHFIPLDKEHYQQLSDRIADEILQDVTARIERASIDEAYLDITDQVDRFDQAVDTAQTIQQRLHDQYNLSCSIGIGPNKLIAKIASDQDKPDGMTVVRPEETTSFMQSLELDEIHGIGSTTIAQLDDMDITTVNELANADTQRLMDVFGEKRGLALKKKAKGKDGSPVEQTSPQQLSRLTTLDENASSFAYISSYLADLAEQLHDQATQQNLYFRTVSVIAIDTDLQTHTRSTSFQTAIQDCNKILQSGNSLLRELLDDHDTRLRRIGLRIQNLKQLDGQQTITAFSDHS